MSDQYDDRNNPRGANSRKPGTGQRGDPTIRERASQNLPGNFNGQNTYAERMAGLSQEGRMEVQAAIKQAEISLERFEGRQRAQRRFKEIAEENKLYRQLLGHPDLKLGDIPINAQAEVQQIEAKARETVRQGEQRKTKEEIRTGEVAIEAAFQSAQARQDQTHGIDPDHNSDPEHGA